MDSKLSLEYGVNAQRGLAEFSDTILTSVRTKDTGEVGELMVDLMDKVNGLEIESLDKKGYLSEVNKRIADMLEQAILEDEVLSLTEAGTKETFELLTDENLSKLKALPQKNMAANILMRVMKEKLNEIRKTNLVVSKTFSERLEAIIEKYNKYS